MTHLTRRLSLALAVLMLASAALAATAGELTAWATDLHAAYADLDATVANQEGSLADAQARETRLDSERLDLHADRAAMTTPCDCDELDALIDDIDALALSVSRSINNWEEEE